MAFVTPVRSVFRGKEPTNDLTIAAAKNGQRYSTRLSIPRSLLREARMSDLPKSRVDVLVGTGPDAGLLKIVAGDAYSLFAVGRNRCGATVGGIASAAFAVGKATVTVGAKSLLIAVPAGFPLIHPEQHVDRAA